MNILGHPYIAYKVTGRLTPDLIAGSWLPDLVPFVPDSVFSFQKIHEGGEKFYSYLKTHQPDWLDLAIGMLCHGVTYGADQFSPQIEEQYAKFKPAVIQKILTATPNLPPPAAQPRFHNFLWWGIDVLILKHESQFMKLLSKNIDLIDLLSISVLLAACFQKDSQAVRRMLDYQFKYLTNNYLSSVAGLVKIWQSAATGLPEKDQVNIVETEKLFEYCAEIMEKDWRDILTKIIDEVKTNLDKEFN